MTLYKSTNCETNIGSHVMIETDFKMPKEAEQNCQFESSFTMTSKEHSASKVAQKFVHFYAKWNLQERILLSTFSFFHFDVRRAFRHIFEV